MHYIFYTFELIQTVNLSLFFQYVWIHSFGVIVVLDIKLLFLSLHQTEIEISFQSINGKCEAKLRVIPSQSVSGRAECPVIEVAELLVELKEESDEAALKL